MTGMTDLSSNNRPLWPDLSTRPDVFYVARFDGDDEVIDADPVTTPEPRDTRRFHQRGLVPLRAAPRTPAPRATLYAPPQPNVVSFPPGRGQRRAGYTDLPPYDGFDDDYSSLRQEYLRQPSQPHASGHTVYGETLAPQHDVLFQVHKTLTGDTVIFISRELWNRIHRWLHLSRRGLIVVVLFVLLLLFGRLPDFIEVGLRILF